MIVTVRIQCDKCDRYVDYDNRETKWPFGRILRSLQDQRWDVIIGTIQSRHICPQCKRPDEFDLCR